MSQNVSRTREFLDKASKWLAWCDDNFIEMKSLGELRRIDGVENRFTNILLYVDSIHQALVDAAKKLGRLEWRDELNRARADDDLLRYMWNARRSEAHDALIKWSPSMRHLEMKVILPETNRLIKYGSVSSYQADMRVLTTAFGASSQDDLLDKIRKGEFPSAFQQLKAGVELSIMVESLTLKGFRIGSETINAPQQHLGRMLPPSALEAARLTIEFYREKYIELVELAH